MRNPVTNTGACSLNQKNSEMTAVSEQNCFAHTKTLAVNTDVCHVRTPEVVSCDILAPVPNMGHQLQHRQQHYLTTTNTAAILIINAIGHSGSLISAR